jgi:hypothetical protein
MRLESTTGEVLARVWGKIFPGKPLGDASIVLHMARTAAASVSLKARLYSHAWLAERRLPSLLPDRLKPIPPQVSAGSLIGVRSPYPEVSAAIHGVMRDALLEAEADGLEAAVTRAHMQAARHRERRALGLPPLDRP